MEGGKEEFLRETDVVRRLSVAVYVSVQKPCESLVPEAGNKLLTFRLQSDHAPSPVEGSFPGFTDQFEIGQNAFDRRLMAVPGVSPEFQLTVDLLLFPQDEIPAGARGEGAKPSFL